VHRWAFSSFSSRDSVAWGGKGILLPTPVLAPQRVCLSYRSWCAVGGGEVEEEGPCSLFPDDGGGGDTGLGRQKYWKMCRRDGCNAVVRLLLVVLPPHTSHVRLGRGRQHRD
jgi:hypothetical protein